MKIVHVSFSDGRGGADIAAYRLHCALRGLGHRSQVLVQLKRSADHDVLGPGGTWGRGVAAVRGLLDAAPLLRYPNRHRIVFASPSWLPERVGHAIARLRPDVVHLHWIARGFVRLETLASLGTPIVWTLHDMWPFTGGCHYDDGCARFVQQCGACPQLGSNRAYDLSRWVWRRKKRAWADAELSLVAPSTWLADRTRASALLGQRRVEVIPNAIDTAVFRLRDQAAARRALSLPVDRPLVLFGAMNAVSDPRKGFFLLRQALVGLAHSHSLDFGVAVFGASAGECERFGDVPLHALGHITDEERLALAYSAADVFVAPSVQDNLPNSVLESLACGVPCVAFETGGIPDLIEHKKNGYLARPFDALDLADGIKWVLADRVRWRTLSKKARDKAEASFAFDVVATRYSGLYEQVVRQRTVRRERRKAGCASASRS